MDLAQTWRILIALALVTLAQAEMDFAILVSSVQQFNEHLRNLSIKANVIDDLVANFGQLTAINETIDFALLSKFIPDSQTLIMIDVQGFSVTKAASPFINLAGEAQLNHFIGTFESGYFDFYAQDGRKLGANCDEYLMSYFDLSPSQLEASNKLELMKAFKGTFSQSFNQFKLSVAMTASRSICPLVFKDARINLFLIDTILQDNFIKQTLFRFSSLPDIGPENDFDLNVEIKNLFVDPIYRTPADFILEKNVFKRLESLFLVGTLSPFEDDELFRSFHFLKALAVFPENMREFIHSSNNKWVAYLNYEHGAVDSADWCAQNSTTLKAWSKNSFILTMPPTSESYSYPEEDFCLFKHYANSHSVIFNHNTTFTKTNSSEQISESLNCLQYFLSKKQACSSVIVLSSEEIAEQYRYYIQFMEETCEIDKRLDLCFANNLTKTKQMHLRELTQYDLIYALEFAEFIGPVVLFPFISCLGFFLNLLVILVINSKVNKSKSFKGNRIYTYLKLNSIFNAIECLISLLTLMNECLGANSIYCSSIQENSIVQLFKIVVVEYVGEIMKTCSIFTMLAFSFERYIHISERKSFLAAKFHNINLKRLTLAVLFLSGALSVFKLFEFSRAKIQLEGMERPNMNILNLIELPWFNIFYISHYVINDLVLLVANLIIDLFLVVHIRASLKKKSFLTGGLASSPKDIERRLKEKQAAERNTNKLLIYQIIMYMFCRFPELVFRLHFYFATDYQMFASPVPSSYAMVCLAYSWCYFMANNVQFFYVISYSVNVYFFIKFNKPFRGALREYLAY